MRIGLGIGLNRFRGAGVAITGLLDQYTGAAAAFSLDTLIYGDHSVEDTAVGSQTNGSTDTYTVRVRRSSDNAVRSFTHTEVGNGTLVTWVGAGNDGFVEAWYNQGSASDAVQSTAANQPKIVSIGQLILENGKAALDFDGVDDFLQPILKVSLRNIAMQFVYNYKTLANSGLALLLSELPQSYNGFNSSTETNNSFLGGGVAQQRPISKSTNQRSWSLYANSSSAAFYLDSVKVGADMTSNSDTPSTHNVTIGSYFNGSVSANIKAQGLIIYQTDQSTNRNAIESALNDYYEIY